MRPTIRTLTLLALTAAGMGTATLITTQAAHAATSIADLTTAGFAILSDDQGNGCHKWSAAIPRGSWTLIGNDCDPNFGDEINTYYTAWLGPLRAMQQALAKPTTPTVTITVAHTIIDAASTAYVTTTAPAETTTLPQQTVTSVSTETATTTLPAITIPITITQPTTITETSQLPAPPAETITNTQTETETGPTTTITQTITRMIQPTKQKKPRLTQRQAKRTG